MKDIFLLNEICAKDKKIYFGWLKYITYQLLLVQVPAPNYKQHILTPTIVRRVCYSLDKLYVKFVCLNLLRWIGREVHEKHFKGGGGKP
jgi:hypothetical protein